MRVGDGEGGGAESRDSPKATAPPATRALGGMPDAAERGARILEPGAKPAAPPSLRPVLCKMEIKLTEMVQRDFRKMRGFPLASWSWSRGVGLSLGPDP